MGSQLKLVPEKFPKKSWKNGHYPPGMGVLKDSRRYFPMRFAQRGAVAMVCCRFLAGSFSYGLAKMVSWLQSWVHPCNKKEFFLGENDDSPMHRVAFLIIFKDTYNINSSFDIHTLLLQTPSRNKFVVSWIQTPADMVFGALLGSFFGRSQRLHLTFTSWHTIHFPKLPWSSRKKQNNNSHCSHQTTSGIWTRQHPSTS